MRDKGGKLAADLSVEGWLMHRPEAQPAVRLVDFEAGHRLELHHDHRIVARARQAVILLGHPRHLLWREGDRRRPAVPRAERHALGAQREFGRCWGRALRRVRRRGGCAGLLHLIVVVESDGIVLLATLPVRRRRSWRRRPGRHLAGRRRRGRRHWRLRRQAGPLARLLVAPGLLIGWDVVDVAKVGAFLPGRGAASIAAARGS